MNTTTEKSVNGFPFSLSDEDDSTAIKTNNVKKHSIIVDAFSDFPNQPNPTTYVGDNNSGEVVDGDEHEIAIALTSNDLPAATNGVSVEEMPNDIDAHVSSSPPFTPVIPSILAPQSTLDRYRHISARPSETMIIRNSTDERLISLLPDQRRTIVARKGAAFTLMVVGELGLGKTTFINTLFGDKFKETTDEHNPIRSTYRRSNNNFDNLMVHVDSNGFGMSIPNGVYPNNNSSSQFQDLYAKTTKIDIREADYEEDGFQVRFTVIDTPGFGDFTNNNFAWVPIVNYIDEQHRMYMLQEEQPDRSRIVDTRVHACLYFVRPSGHGLLPLDIQAMSELSKRVNLIPIISKADSFTPRELQHFKKSIREAIQAEGINIYNPSLWFDYDDKNGNGFTNGNAEDTSDISESGTDSAATAVHNKKSSKNYNWEDDMPFAIISSEDVINVDGRKVRGRKYDWGIAEVDNEEHCDFVKLRNVLMSNYMFDLIDTTVETHYSKYREEMMRQRIELVPDKSVIDEEGGISTLCAISKFGYAYLQNNIRDKNPILINGKARIRKQFESVLSFQEQKFNNWTLELAAKKEELSNDLTKVKEE